jgi:hypothetical protein
VHRNLSAAYYSYQRTDDRAQDPPARATLLQNPNLGYRRTGNGCLSLGIAARVGSLPDIEHEGLIPHGQRLARDKLSLRKPNRHDMTKYHRGQFVPPEFCLACAGGSTGKTEAEQRYNQPTSSGKKHGQVHRRSRPISP